MEFGRVERPEEVDYTLRADPEANRMVFSGHAPAGFQAYFGSSQWNDPAYPGLLYPGTVKKGEELRWYSRQFNTIEFNPSFYAIPKTEHIARWSAMVPPGFTFCCKVPRAISHAARLETAVPLMSAFLETVQGFAAAAGPVFLQLPPQVPVQKLEETVRFLSLFSSRHPVFLEVRHPSWFIGDGFPQTAAGMLREAGIGLVISDVSGRRDAAHMTLTRPEAMVRWVGNMGHETDRERLERWLERLEDWKRQGLQKLWFFLHQPDPGYVPESAVWFSKRLEEAGFGIRPVVLQEKQGGLFL